MTSDDSMLSGWFVAPRGKFGRADASCEFLHEPAADAHFSTTETYWFVAVLPEQQLVADFYIWLRPKLGVCHAGVWMYSGFVDHPLLSRHYDFRQALPLPQVKGNSIDVPSMGLSVEITEPMRSARIRYRPPGNEGVAAELTARAVMPLAVTGDEKHTDQALWCTGSLTLDGQLIAVDGPGFRDRSWNSARPEDSQAHPPLAYVWGVLDGGRLAFNFRAGDDPSQAVEWAGAYDLTAEKQFHDGWIFAEGQLRKIVKMSKRTERSASERMRPVAIHIECEDDTGARYRLSGHARSGMWLTPWHNVFAWFELMEWELNGLRGYGEVQDFTWADYCKRFWKR